MIRTILAAFAALFITGCASQLQAVSAFNQSAAVAMKSAGDIAVGDVKAALCHLTIDDYSRHAELTDALNSLCLSGATQTSTTQAQTLKQFQAKQPAPAQ